jgi:nonsense-mediated mRNA decay protein 3
VLLTFCVECGIEVGDEELRGGLCRDCFLERHAPVEAPTVIDIVRCALCGATLRRGTWSNIDTSLAGAGEELVTRHVAANAVEDALILVEGGSLVSVDFDMVNEGKAVLLVNAHVRVDVMGSDVEHVVTSRVRVHNEVCPVCSKRVGSYYEALVQFRGTRERPATQAELDEATALAVGEIARLSVASREVNLTKTEELHGGLDFYITTQAAGAQVAKSLCSRFNATSTTSTTMVGRKDGRDMVRVTHSVRLPDLRRGDYVMSKGQLMKVVSATAKEANLRPSAGEGKPRRVSRDDRTKLRFVGDASAPEEAVLVSKRESDIQVLDPVTFRTADLSIPKGYDPAGRETVMVLRIEGELHLVE